MTRMNARAFRALAALLFLIAAGAAWGLDSSVQQLAVSIAPDWDAMHGRIQLFERDGKRWKPVGAPWPVNYGKSGLVWGRGVLGTDEPGTHKTERDKRAPAGVFKIGKIYT